MKKAADFIVEKRVPIFVIVMALTLISALLIPKVGINTDMTKYLPNDSSMKIGMDLMEEEFPDADDDYTIRVMFKGLNDRKKADMLTKLSGIRYVSEVDYDSKDTDYNRGKYTKYVLHTEYDYGTPEEQSIEQTLEAVYQQNDMQYKNDSTDGPDLPTWVVITAVALLMLILIIMSGSWIEPFLFLFTIGVAVTVNLGSNIFLGTISEKTFSVAAILQLVLSIDYSIILTNRYRQELKYTDDKKAAMKEAITGAFSSISSSSLTTVVGLLAMVFMSFKIGFDMGVVLAKGVFLSVVSVFLILPGLILFFSGLLEKTEKRAPVIPTRGLASFCDRFRAPLTLFFIALFAAACYLQTRTDISYYMAEEDPIAQIFPTTSTVVMLYDNQDDDKVTAIAEQLEEMNNVQSAVNYSNTLAKQHTAAEMVDAIDDLSESMGNGKKRDIDPDESIYRMLYYKYYGEEASSITATDFMRFITDDVLKNENFRPYIGSDMTENAEMIRKLSDAETLQKSMTAKELSEFFEMKQSDCEQLFLYYFIKHEGAETKKMTVREFVDFVLNDLAKDETYASLFDEDTLNQMRTLQKFTDTEQLKTKLTATEIADTLGITEEQAKMLLVYHSAMQTDYQPRTMTIQELTAFLKNDVAQNENFSSYFQADTAAKLDQLAAFTDTDQITAQRYAAGLASYLSMEDSTVRMLLRMDGRNLDFDGTTMTIADFTGFLETMLREPAYVSAFDQNMRSRIGSMRQIVELASSGQAVNAATLAQILQMDAGFVSQLFAGYSAQTGQEINAMPLTNFIDFIVGNVMPNPAYAPYFNAETSANLSMLQRLCHAAASGDAYHDYELEQIFGMSNSQIRMIISLFYGDDTKTMNVYDFVDYLLSDTLQNPVVASKIDAGAADKLRQLKNIMDMALRNTQLNERNAAALFNMEADTMRLLYAMKEQRTNTPKLSLETLISFLTENRQALSDLTDEEMFSKLDMLKKITDAVLADEQLDQTRLSELTDIDTGTAQQLSLLYTYKNGDTENWKLSTEKFVKFLVSDVLDDPEMSDRFGTDDRKKLTSASKIISAVVSGRAYSCEDMTELFEGMSDDIDANTMQLLYLYHDANASPEYTRTMSIEQLMNYLNDTLIHDEVFKKMLDRETISDIKQNAADLNEGIGQLKGEHYSRLILSVTVPEEGPVTEAFYQDLNEKCSTLKGSYHFIGSSAMNYEMSQTFGKEYLFITILTALAIFIVVLITFRSVAVPVILVLLVQCGVYVTVTAIGFQGYSIHYLALMIVQCILMGSTIDYGILFSNYYRESRKRFDRAYALKKAFSGSIHTIMTSGLIIVTVTAILGQCFGEPTIEQICQTISIGAASVIIMIIFILPGILACLDKYTGGKDRLQIKPSARRKQYMPYN